LANSRLARSQFQSISETVDLVFHPNTIISLASSAGGGGLMQIRTAGSIWALCLVFSGSVLQASCDTPDLGSTPHQNTNSLREPTAVLRNLPSTAAPPDQSQSPVSDDLRRHLWSAEFIQALSKDPKRLIYVIEAKDDPERAAAFRGSNTFKMNFVGAADAGDLVPKGFNFAYDIWQEIAGAADPEDAAKRVEAHFNRFPDDFYSFADSVYDTLTKPGSGSGRSRSRLSFRHGRRIYPRRTDTIRRFKPCPS
jgi:hypothetical protein